MLESQDTGIAQQHSVKAEQLVQIEQVMRTASLETVLAYRNDIVIQSFMSKFDVTRSEAERIFVEALRWLWYIASTTPTKDNPEAHGIDQAMFIIDEMWHTFILVTENYTKFCDDMFGRYIHHSPGSAGTVAYGADYTIDDGPDGKKKALAKAVSRKRAKYKDIHERLGESVFVTWYQEFPQAYTVDAIYRLRKR